MDELLNWVFLHPIRTDVIIFAVVTGTIAYVLRKQRRVRRTLHRRIWAMNLKRKDLERLHLMRFEDAITDIAFEMVARGEMTEQQEKDWYLFFANNYGMKGLIPGHGRGNPASVKKGIRFRINWLWSTPKPDIPGPKPGVKEDAQYNGKDTPTKQRSKYVKD